MTSHGGNEGVNEYLRNVVEWLSNDAAHRKMFVESVVAVFKLEDLSPEPTLADLASLDERHQLVLVGINNCLFFGLYYTSFLSPGRVTKPKQSACCTEGGFSFS